MHSRIAGIARNVLEELSLGRLILPEKKCRELTRKQKPCSNFPMKDSDYCYIHSFGKIKRVPLWKSATVHLGLLLSIAGLFYSAGSYYFGATGKQIETVKKDTETLVNELIIVRHSELLREYPEGYVIFYVNEKNQINLPSNSVFYDQNRYTVKWDEAKISSNNRSLLHILLIRS
jgi:hypothetical protein